MKKTISKYFFYEFIRYFTVVLFALAAIIWTIQAVNLLDLVVDDGHTFYLYLTYTGLTLPKVLTKLIPFSFLIASILTILKFDKDNELIVLWTSGLNKIYVVNLIFRISLLIMVIQLALTIFITPKTLNYSRSLIKNSELQFIPSLLKEKRFNDAVVGLTIFVEKKYEDGKYENIFIRDDSNVLTKVSDGSSTIFAKYGYIGKDKKNLLLFDGNIQNLEDSGSISIITFAKTEVNITGLSTSSISEPKLQETSTIQIIQCMRDKNINTHNCSQHRDEKKEAKIEINKRFGMPFFIPLIALISCFLLATNKEKKFYGIRKNLYFLIGFIILITAEITVRYSGTSLNHTVIYYLMPVCLFPLIYLTLLKKFKYENLQN